MVLKRRKIVCEEKLNDNMRACNCVRKARVEMSQIEIAETF